MQIKIPFTDISLRMDVGKSIGKWTDSDDGSLSNAFSSTMTENRALGIDAVYACVNLYARTMASMPLVLYKKTATGKQRATEHPLYALLHNEPNPNMSSHTFRKTMEAALKLWGNAYAWIEFDQYYKVKALWPLLPGSVFPQRSMNTGEIFYDATLWNGQSRRFRAYEMLHIAGLGFDGIMGKSPIRQFAETIGLNLDIKKYGSKFFKNGARPSGVLTHPGVISEDAQRRLENKFNQRYSGVENSGRTILLEEGMQYSSIGVPPEEAQFLESRKYGVTEIARIYGIPAHMIGDLEHATFSNIEHLAIEFAKHSVMPECVNWEQELMRKLLNDQERELYEIEFNMEGLVRGDMQSRYAAYATGRQWGFLSVNDIRAKENMSNIPEGDTTLVPLNMIASDMAEPYWKARIENVKSKGVIKDAK